MNYTLIFHTSIEMDLNEAYQWYEEQEQGLGERFLSELILIYNQLEIHPAYYSRTIQNYHRVVLKHFPYVVAFEIIEKSVFVYAVFHTSRNPREILKRKKHDK